MITNLHQKRPLWLFVDAIALSVGLLIISCQDHLNVNANKTINVPITINITNNNDNRTYQNTTNNQRQIPPPNGPSGIISFPNTGVPSIDLQKNLSLKFLDQTRYELRQDNVLTHSGTYEQIKVISDNREAIRFNMSGQALILFLALTNGNPSTIILSGTDSSNTLFDLPLTYR